MEKSPAFKTCERRPGGCVITEFEDSNTVKKITTYLSDLGLNDAFMVICFLYSRVYQRHKFGADAIFKSETPNHKHSDVR